MIATLISATDAGITVQRNVISEAVRHKRDARVTE